MDRTLSIAPMLDHTDRFFRYFMRLITRHAVLYTEMITTGALLKGDTQRLLEFDPIEHPVALQLGGSNPVELAQCARLGQSRGYDEINLNLGCPSKRVQNGRFGACLMAEPQLVSECIQAMKEACDIPITVKSRIGIDHNDSYNALAKFVDSLACAGTDSFIIHARKAWLKGLSPKQNRTVPPLRYDILWRLKQDFPDLEIVLNGGIKTLAQISEQLQRMDGVMIGREAYQNPWSLAEADSCLFQREPESRTRRQVIQEFLPFVERQLQRDICLPTIARHLLGLYNGVPGARSWRRYLSEHAHHRGAGVEVIQHAAALIEQE